ncbi:MAG TPA: hypothetical protein VMQ45_08010 [Burkholderiaceae bacterium]|nr:hypothetical protein [Burkholderiaceae bacterium]
MDLTRWESLAMAVVALALCAGCANLVVRGPGADPVKITKNPEEVTGCKAVGNVNANAFLSVGSDEYVRQMQNQAIGLEGDVVLVTTAPAVGVAYRCAAAAH